MSALQLTPLFTLQAALDARIHANHKTSYPQTAHARTLALLVELGEFANTTRTFKFWSLKGPEPLAVVLDEYADALHFLLSLGLAYNLTFTEVEIKPFAGNLTEGLLATYQAVAQFQTTPTMTTYQHLFEVFVSLIPLLGVDGQTVIDAYQKKLAVNYARQEQKY